MKSSRVFLVVFLAITLIILVVGEARAASGGFSSTILAEGVVVFGLYGAFIGAIVGAIAYAIHRAVTGRKKVSSASPVTA